jgi:hypothetical protein
MRRRSTAGGNVEQLLDDLNTLTEFESAKDWTMHYKGKDVPFSREAFESMVPLTPRAYRERMEQDLNEMRSAAGLEVRGNYDAKDKSLQSIQSAAGII